MDQVFTALNRRQAMLLLTTVAFGGQEALPGFAHLPEVEGELLRHRAEQLLQIPRDKRIPLLIHELKRRMSAQRSQLLSADPQALAALLASGAEGDRGGGAARTPDDARRAGPGAAARRRA